jgi:hypothetical protein
MLMMSTGLGVVVAWSSDPQAGDVAILEVAPNQQVNAQCIQERERLRSASLYPLSYERSVPQGT